VFPISTANGITSQQSHEIILTNNNNGDRHFWPAGSQDLGIVCR